MLIEELLEEAVGQGASDIHISANLPPVFRIDGKLIRTNHEMLTAENVEIAFSDSVDPFLAGDKPESLPKPDSTGNPWWIAIAMLLIGLGMGLKFLSDRVKSAQERQMAEIAMLHEKSQDQEKQLRDVNLKAAELIERQSQLAQGMLEQKQQAQKAGDRHGQRQGGQKDLLPEFHVSALQSVAHPGQGHEFFREMQLLPQPQEYRLFLLLPDHIRIIRQAKNRQDNIIFKHSNSSFRKTFCPINTGQNAISFRGLPLPKPERAALRFPEVWRTLLIPA